MTYNAFYKYNIPSQISPEAPTEWRSVTLGQNFVAANPQDPSKTVVVPSRVLNVYLPTGVQGDNAIIYEAVTGVTCTYYPAYNGVHLVRANKIISIGVDIDSTTFQWGT